MGKLRSFYGDIYFADVNADGSLAGNWLPVGEAYPLGLQLTKEVGKILGRTIATNGNVIGSKERPAETGGSLTMFDYTANNIARALSGMVTTRAISETTLSAEVVTVGKYGEFVDIGYEDLSSVVVQDSTDTTTYVLNTDYKLDAVSGMISPISGGSIAEDAELHISGTSAANTDQRVTIGAGTSQHVAIKGTLKDDFDGLDHKLYLRKVRLTSNNETVLLSSPDTDREQLDFALTPEIPTGQSDYGYIDGLPI